MGIFRWLAEHWFDSVETLGVIGGFLFTAYIARKDERARQIGNMFAVNERHDFIWSQLEQPSLARIRKNNVDLQKQPVTDQEWAFVTMLLLHLDTVRRASNAGLFIKLGGVQSDIRYFLSLPVPKAVWEMIKPFQDPEFIELVENALRK
ncbi:MAG: hypothetical protein P4N59_14695 [Negativicutes bacterium]|nr:hypothetical protein [Negativicutes bacterium]